MGAEGDNRPAIGTGNVSANQEAGSEAEMQRKSGSGVADTHSGVGEDRADTASGLLAPHE